MADESTFRGFLTGASDVTDIVSTRIYPGNAPADVLPPYLVYRVVSSVPDNTLSKTAALTAKNRIQIDAYSTDYLTLSTTLRDALHAALAPHGYILLEQDVFEDDTRLHRRIIDFSWFNNAGA